jgi:hypothetical protein
MSVRKPSTVAELGRLLELQALRSKLVVGVEDAARLLNTSENRMYELVRSGAIRQVQGLTSNGKISIAVSELERFVQVNTERLPVDPARARFDRAAHVRAV